MESRSERALKVAGNSFIVFGSLWVIVFVLYRPAAEAGWVSDTTEWLYTIRHKSFADYVNTQQARGSLYQLTQLTTYGLYKLFGTSPWPWHIAFITVHCANASVVYSVCRRLFESAGIKFPVGVALAGVLLFSICPHVSEVLVWKAAFHYSFSMLMTMTVVWLVQQYLARPLMSYVWLAGGLFLISSFGHEFFYAAPVFSFTLIIWYKFVLRADARTCGNALRYFTLPMAAIVVAHLVLTTIISGTYSGASVDELHQPLVAYLSKPPIHLFNVLVFGRFLSPEAIQAVHAFFNSLAGIGFFYGGSVAVFSFLLFRARKATASPFLLIFVWTTACLALVSPMWIADSLLIIFDRYAYFALPFIYMLVAGAALTLRRRVAIAMLSIFALINVYYTTQLVSYWKQSALITRSLLHSFQPKAGKTVLILNLPEYMNGAPMFGPWRHFSFGEAHELIAGAPTTQKVYDVASYNMVTPADSVRVSFGPDSVVHVKLFQPGSWWWNNLWGAHNYENEAYRFVLASSGTEYTLFLKQPAERYDILYQAGDRWRSVTLPVSGQSQ